MQRIRWTGDKKILCTTSLASCALLLLILLLPIGQKRWIGAITLTLVTLLTLHLVKKRTAPSIHRKQVLLLMAVFGLLYTVIYYLLGTLFGLERTLTALSLSSLLWFIPPVTVLIVFSELLRTRLLAQKSRLASAAAYVCCVAAELLCLLASGGVSSPDRFVDLLSLIFFPACIANFTYHYLAARYGASPNIAYRLIRVLLPCFVLYTPAVPDALLAFLKLLSPLLILWLMRLLYEKKDRVAKRKSRAPLYIATVLSLCAMLMVTMLISGRFRYAVLVIASESMTGEINKGDIVVYERFEKQTIQEDQVLIFLKKGTLTVHRVIDIEHIDGQTRYYTKGDANEEADLGYIIDDQIVGITKITFPYIGYASIWLSGLFAEPS